MCKRSMGERGKTIGQKYMVPERYFFAKYWARRYWQGFQRRDLSFPLRLLRRTNFYGSLARLPGSTSPMGRK